MNATAQSQLLLVARILFGVLFLVPGIRFAMTFGPTVAYFTRLGFPAPELMVWLAIIIEIVGGLVLITGWQTKWASWLLILYVVIATAMAHRFWEFDAAQQFNQLNHLLKNLAIIGGLLYVVIQGPGVLSVDGRSKTA
ncbi:MAG: hypothetical protein A3D95_06800 [Betaproteobacteria bacterium RIFCSPHIGHO2_12_FULL_69_13]|nr:MAG: hypothetical protein A3D95_06800 [Betaproteobacteria bacterium RIFCSPHIGHO2_12_FULL_69_13]